MELTPVVSLETAKEYLRVDSTDEDALIEIIIASAEEMVRNISRIGHAEWQEIQKVDTGDDGPMISVRTEAYSRDAIVQMRELLKVAILYAVGYLYEHREEADHHDLTITLRNLLFAIREGVV